MTEEAKEAKRAYYREWRKKNPNKGKEYTARYWEKKAAEKEQEKGQNKSNREKAAL